MGQQISQHQLEYRDRLRAMYGTETTIRLMHQLVQ